ncbi:sugar phosphate nucleotidyltransferase [Candidatus Saccharibacteria bacterium]|nr:sugar phosphate nucleotidyltransferase [Candidatus Saccharibacteria bacterium]
MIKTAIVPVAGYGTRRLPITKAVEKSMLPVGNRPIVDFAVEDCILAGIKDIVFVITETGEKSQIETYYGRNARLEEFLAARNATEKLKMLETAPSDVRFHFVKQDANDKYGTAVPVALAVKELGLNESVAFCNGDDFFWDSKDGSEEKNLVSHITHDEAAIIGVRLPKEEITKFAMIEKNTDGFMTNIVEKPKLAEITSDLANINRFILSPALLTEIVNYVDNHHFGATDQEYFITDPILNFVRGGGKMRVVPASGRFMDCGSLEGWLYANQVDAGLSK